jgi:hypothetical protein
MVGGFAIGAALFTTYRPDAPARRGDERAATLPQIKDLTRS